MNDQDITLKLSLVNAVLGYLGTRPYAEVFRLVERLHAQALPQVEAAEQAQDIKPETHQLQGVAK